MISLEPLDPTMSEANSIRGLFSYEKNKWYGHVGGVYVCVYVFWYFIFLLNHLELDLCYLEPQLIHLV